MAHFLLRAAAGALLLSLPAAAQSVNAECGLRGADTLIAGGVTGKRCLDLKALNGQNVVIPANVTRIDNTGFALCETSRSDGGAVDIVYVLDQSGSMGINYAWISPAKTDTLYFESFNSGCNLGTADARGFGTLTIPNESTVRTVPLLNPEKKPTGCTNTSGDPFTQRGIAFKEAIDFQAQRAPNSTAGYMGFANGVIGPVRPAKLNTQADVDRVKAGIVLGLNPNTNYTAPLDTAKRWLKNPAITSNPNKAVIFLSDGRPTVDQARINTVLDSTYPGQPGVMPPVYGILLGKPTADTAILSDISTRTGGKFFLIPPSRPDSLKAVVAQILNVILRQYRPVGAVVTNGSTAPASMGTAGASDFTRQDADSWLLNLDKNVPLLKQQGNEIKVKTQFLDQTGQTSPDSASFILTTTGPDESVNQNLPGTQFGVVCIELPPPVDPVKVAYIKDTDGDGAGDLVVLAFAKPLAQLPASLEAYWPDGGAASKNQAAPKLSFLTASGNTVILADFSASPFPVAATGIPPGGAPVAVLPAGGVFGAQRPPLEDSIGPILVSGTLKPYNPTQAGSGPKIYVDTLTAIASEAIRSYAQWSTVLVWSKPVGGKCEDYEHARPVVPASNPMISGGGTTVTILVSSQSGAPAPVQGDCIYLNVDGTYTDLRFNVPPKHGVPLVGPKPPSQIELFRGYPPVAGLDPNLPTFQVSVQDTRDSTKGGYATETTPGSRSYAVYWIPPVGFVENMPFNPIIPPLTAPATGSEITEPTKLPPGISTVQVVSTGKYIADVSIYDNKGMFLKRFKQAFGYQGELSNRRRIAPKGMVSYLVWDMKDQQGQKAGQGVYVWKVFFRMENGKQEIQYTRTGAVRGFGWQAN